MNILKNVPHSIGCEIGVHTGDTSIVLLEGLPTIKKYHAIDPWESYIKYDGKKYRKPGHKYIKSWSKALRHFKSRIKKFGKKIIVHQMTSVEASKKIEDESLDWVFIDANHDYEYIKENLEIWSKKVKSGGIISGHDYGNKWKGIKKAVDEFVPSDKLHIENFYIWWYKK